MPKTATATPLADHKPTATELSFRLDQGLSNLKYDVDSLVWGCEELWHQTFKRGGDNEHLSRFPVIVLALISEKLGPLAKDAERLESLIAKGSCHD